MSDIVADAKAWLADIGGGQRLQTHSGNCHKWHSTCLVGKLIREIERLRTPTSHTTQSEGSVPIGCTLTDEEREAIEQMLDEVAGKAPAASWVPATLRKLLERLNT